MLHLVEKRRAVFTQPVEQGLCTRCQCLGLSVALRGGKAEPVGALTAGQQHDGRARQRRGGACGCIGAAACAAMQALPDEAAGAAEVIEPVDLVIGHACGQQGRFPCGGRRFEAFELAEHAGQGFGATHAGAGRDMLPVQQKADEVALWHGFDFAPQSPQCVAMDAREQAAFAPFLLLHARRKTPAKHVALGFQ